ncbi:Transcription factor bHLH91 [Spatholobus suberectus]|nr:Transcription factor bHLH91 [Spatholobus suberectus]
MHMALTRKEHSHKYRDKDRSLCGPKMYEESGCFDPNAMMAQGTGAGEDCFAQMVPDSEAALEAVMTATATHTQNTFAVENLPYSYSSGEDAANETATSFTLTNRVAAAATALEIIAHPQQNAYNHINNLHTQFAEVVNHGSSQELYSFPHSTTLERGHRHQNQQFPYPTPTPDLLNLLHLPTTPAGNSFENPTNLPKPSGPMGTADSTNVSSVSYDPFLHPNLQAPPQAALRELLPHMPNDFAFGSGDDIEGSGVAYQDYGNGVTEFTEDVSYVGKKRGGKRTKQFTSTTERQRRVDLSSKFDALKQLIPNPSKSDRASVVGDAIEYIRELLRAVNELKLLAEKKRHEKERVMMRHKVETEGDSKVEAIGDPDDRSYIESLRSSWIQRKSKDTEVDVRIVDNEVIIKLVQRKKIDCLVHVSLALDELNLDLQHVAGGHIGDFCSYLFNTKICEGSSVYASAIANKLIEVMDSSLAAAGLT